MDDPQKVCIVCGMPLKEPNDYPSGDVTKDYCKYCGDAGNIYQYGTLVQVMKKYLMSTKHMAEEEALLAAEAMIKDCVAYKAGRVPKEMGSYTTHKSVL